jgi:3-(3-hydroxy-phenyl)propionate hydroxylase
LDRDVNARHAVLIAGGGPTGLTLASLLARDGVNCILAERKPCTTQFPKMARGAA